MDYPNIQPPDPNARYLNMHGSPTADPARWVDSWPLSELGPDGVAELKNDLRMALAGCYGILTNNHEQRQLFQARAFDAIAARVLEYGLLSEEMMTGPLRDMVMEAAISAELSWAPSLTANEVVSAQVRPASPPPEVVVVGHYLVPPMYLTDLESILAPRILEWRTKLGARVESSRTPGKETAQDRAARRHAFFDPLLAQCGLTASQLSAKAGVRKTTLYEYLDGTRQGMEPDNRSLIATFFGIAVKDIPR